MKNLILAAGAGGFIAANLPKNFYLKGTASAR